MQNTNNNYANGFIYLKAKRAAFEFFETIRKYCQLEHKKVELVKILDDKIPNLYNYLLSTAVIMLTLIVGYAEKSNCALALVGIGLSDFAAEVIAYSIALCGILSGHYLAVGRKERKVDEFSGKLIIFNRDFVMGIVLGVVYICFQIFLILWASNGTGGTSNTPIYYILFSLFLAFLEMLLGGMLHKAILAISYLIITLRQRFLLRRAKKTAEKTEKYVQQFLYGLTATGTPVQEDLMNDHILAARMYYNTGEFNCPTNQND